MPATAAARRVAATPARRSTAARPALKPRPRRAHTGARAAQPRRAPQRPRRRSQVTPVGGFVPLAVGRTAGAVGGIADSGLVVRLTRGRLWIGVLGVLLVGIVALNVWALSLNAASSKVAGQTDGLKRANSALQARIAGELSNERILAAAGRLGLAYPGTEAITYLRPNADSARIAARRLSRGELTLGAAAPAGIVTVTPAAPVAEEALVAPEAEVTPVAEAAATDSAAPAPAPAAPATTASGGGVIAP